MTEDEIPLTVGDRVICVNANLSCLMEGKEYAVKEIAYFGDYGVVLQEFPDARFYPERFSKVTK